MRQPFSLPISRNTLNFYIGDWAEQANASVRITYADTVLLATVCMSAEPKEGDFLPLMVDYQERTYAMGKIPGGFIKREGRPKDTEILTSRLIDRPLRPLFPKGFTNEVQIVAMLLSSDRENAPDILAINAASCALLVSDIPFYKPVGAVRVGKCGNEFIVNPTYQEREDALVDLVVVGTDEKIVMLEGLIHQQSEEVILQAIEFARPFIKDIVSLQKKIQSELGKEKITLAEKPDTSRVRDFIEKESKEVLEKLYETTDKSLSKKIVDQTIESFYQTLLEDNPDLEKETIKNIFFSLQEKFVREKILKEERRPDGRGLNQIRDIDCKVRVLPRTHGSSIFRRGKTQSLAITTLGTSSDEQFIEALAGEKTKHFMLHYTFPPFSTGEVKFLKAPSRREIGHGALAEKSLLPVLPSKEEFPYTIRVVSEILSSNGSSSMATVCATSLSLMDAGVPIKAQVAGIAIGLVQEGENYKILTDIAGVEDHYGDMDFKIAGTNKGITAIQLDVKIDGLSRNIIEESLRKAKEAREAILEIMNKALSAPREGISQYAPKIRAIKIELDKIGNVIGPGGSTIRRLTREHNVNIDIDDETGTVSIVAEREEDLERAAKVVINLTRDVEVGEIYEGKITRFTNFGAFCEIFPGKTGLIHISEISSQFVKDPRDVLSEGEIVKVKVKNIDPQGRINLSIKDAV